MKTKITITKIGCNKLTILCLIFFLVSSYSTFAQVDHENEWWYQIIMKHELEIKNYNSYDNLFEMGTTNSISSKVVKLENAIIIIRETDDNYSIITSPIAYHDLSNNIIKAEDCTWESYHNISNITETSEIIKCKFLKYDIKSHKGFIEESALVNN